MKPAFGSSAPRFGSSSRLMDAQSDSQRDGERLQPPDGLGMERTGSHSSTSSTRSASRASDNPFFGSGAAARDRLTKSSTSAQSGSGKVIASLQSDLISARSTIDSTQSQLRLSQKAVESLQRSLDDVKDKSNTVTLERDSLSNILTRKERLLDEALARAKASEAKLAALSETHDELTRRHREESEAKTRELEHERGRAARADAEYSALKGGMASLSEGWRKDLTWLREDLAKVLEHHRKEVQAVSTSANAALQGRASAGDAFRTLLEALQGCQRDFETRCRGILQRLPGGSGLDAEAQAQVDELAGELKALKRRIQQHGATANVTA